MMSVRSVPLVNADGARLCIASGVMPVSSSRLAFIVNNEPVIQVSGVQLAQGLGDWAQKLGNKAYMLDLVAAWRRLATVAGEGSLQMYLDWRGWPRPLSDHVIGNGNKGVLCRLTKY
jgi:hypothetical protein